MRHCIRILMVSTLLFLVLGSCKKEAPSQEPACPPCAEPSLPDAEQRVATEDTVTVKVFMTITGMSILDTKKDNEPLNVLIPEFPQHEAFLYADKRHVMTSPRTILKEPAQSPMWDVVLLNGDDLSIGAPPKESSLKYTIKGGSCATLSNRTSLRWAPSLSDVLKQPVKLKSAIPLEGRIRIEKGLLYSAPQDVYVWRFLNPPKGAFHEQMLTGAVVHAFTVDLPKSQPTLTISAQPIGGGTATTLATLTAYGDEIRFIIGTTLPQYRLPGTGTNGLVDDHFVHYYALLDPASVVDSAGNPVTPVTKPHWTSRHCLYPSTTLVNCGPTRP